MTKRNDLLVAAASRVIHERGAAATTLALVASEAAVPLGNVYYYFKTKDELVAAVVEARLGELRHFLSLADKKASPLERLCFVVGAFESRAEEIVRLGCPYGTLASELEKDTSTQTAKAGQLLSLQIDWMETQFRALRARAAQARAVELVAAIQGACLVAHGLHDAALFKRRLGDLERDLRAQFRKDS